ncbi:Growth hormone-releasing hormone receptor [Dissostichus eleginoides]|uniref:Growth hormone-releasing hormone receptor n=1 Tax=Dissostichus eleginoides TaxID=100907 RepID=A0AAD9C9R6_DISEL|nr:Growth hormone-releasing hormone receptor [Dissostichus eleginoides]
MSCLIGGILLTLWLPQTLEREERLCHQFIAEQGNTSSEGCQPFWDAVACWPHAAVGETVERRCPAVFSLFRNNTGSVSRNCTSGGWSRAFPPYHIACSVDDDIPETEQSYFATVKMIYTVGYSISLAVLAVAVFILLLFRRLRCARNFIHIQLFISFILKAVAVFIKDATLFSSEDTNHCTLSTSSVPLGLQPAGMGKQMTDFKPILEDSVPVLFIVMWIGSRVYFEDTECWDINEDSPYWWIIKGPIVVSIAVNFLLLMNIIRILIQKLNPRLIHFNNSSQYRRLTKSTLLLIPLFGTHYMVFNFLPDYFNVNLRFCIELCMGSFQGLLVAILYCFLNQEVQKEVHMQWLRWQERSYGVVSPAAKCSQMDTPF